MSASVESNPQNSPHTHRYLPMNASPRSYVQSLVKEYLTHYGFEETVLSFKSELINTDNRLELSGMGETDVESKLLNSLERGKKTEFFKFYDKLFVKNEPETARMEFEIQIYFTLFPLFDNDVNKYKNRVKEFQLFLASQEGNSTFTDDENFLHYFLLPYIKNPKNHQKFASLFHPRPKRDEMFRKIKKFVVGKIRKKKLRVSLNKTTKLEKLCEENVKYQELFGIVGQMLTALKGVITGKKLNQKFYEVIAKKVHRLRPRVSANPSPRSNVRRSSSSSVDQSTEFFRHLDYEQIRFDLYEDNSHMTVNEKTRILQALRWRVQKCVDEKRKEVIFSFVNNDILADDLPWESGDICEYYLRLINSLLLNSNGVRYIGKKKILLGKMIKMLESTLVILKSDELLQSEMVRLLVVILQKVSSVGGKVCTTLLDLGIVHLIVILLRKVPHSIMSERDPPQMATVIIDYTAALLMNVVNVKDSITYCEREKDIVLELRKFCEYDNGNVREHINGCLYTLLRHSRIMKESAVLINLKKLLTIMMEKNQKNKEQVLQLKFIQEVIDKPAIEFKPVEIDDSADGEDEEDDEDWINEEIVNEAIVQEEESVNDSVRKTGEDVLRQYFTDTKDAKNATINFLRKSRIGLRKSSGEKKNSVRQSKKIHVKMRTTPKENLPEVSFSFKKVKLESMLENLKMSDVLGAGSGEDDEDERNINDEFVIKADTYSLETSSEESDGDGEEDEDEEKDEDEDEDEESDDDEEEESDEELGEIEIDDDDDDN